MNKNILRKQVNGVYSSERLHILQSPGVRDGFVVACIAADAYTLFSVFDLLLTERQDMTIVITITVAGAMNIIPMLIAACLWNENLKKMMREVLCGMLLTLFILLFAATFGLRFSSRELLFQSTSGLESLAEQVMQEDMEADAEAVTEEKEDSTTTAQDVLAIVLGLEPLATSIIAFCISYEVSPYRKRRKVKELNKIELLIEINNVKMMICELKKDMAFDQEAYDTKLYDAMKELINFTAEEDGIKARRLLAEAEGTPEAVEYLMERSWKNMQSSDTESELTLRTSKGNRSGIKMVPGDRTA